MKKLILISLVLFVLAVSFASAQNETSEDLGEDVVESAPLSTCGGDTPCQCGDTIIEDYTMAYDLENCPANGLNIGSGIALDCNGHTIDSEPGSGSYGVIIRGNGITVKDCVITDFKFGINVDGSYDAYGNFIYDNNLTNLNVVGSRGFSLYNTHSNLIHNNLLTGNEYGGYVYGTSTGNTIWYNEFTNNYLNAKEFSSGNAWDYNEIGNYWDDFEENEGYPNYYEIFGEGDGRDHCANGICDSDGDGVMNSIDNCQFDYNPLQEDVDLDDVGDVCDNCMEIPNNDQLNFDTDEYGNVCDNCDYHSNPSQTDFDNDGVGDWCDNCIMTKNTNQADDDGDGIGNKCENKNYMCMAIGEGQIEP